MDQAINQFQPTYKNIHAVKLTKNYSCTARSSFYKLKIDFFQEISSVEPFLLILILHVK